MKITNWCKKLAAGLVAGGLMVPAAMAADLNVNLVTNPGFENLDVTDNHILNWTDGSTVGFTYNSGVYDNGGPLAGGGNFYFTANGGSNPNGPGQVSQLIDVSTGASGSLIASGDAYFNMRAFFTTYLGDNDRGRLHLDFLDSGSTSLGTAFAGPVVNLQDWTQFGNAGLIPVGTQTVQVSVFGIAGNGGPDGYIDNVDFQIGTEPLLPNLDLTVDRTDGSIVLGNRTGGSVNISGYQITSAFQALDPAAWLSIANNYDMNDGGEVDQNNNWSEFTQTGAHGDLSEGELDTGLGATLSHTQSVDIGSAGAWIRNSNEDLVLQYISSGIVTIGSVNFVGAAPFARGDINTDGVINAADWMVFRSNQHADLSGFSLAEAYRRGDLNGDLQNTHPDFVAFKAAYDTANGAGALVALIASQNSVPEPSSVILVLSVGLLWGIAGRRSTLLRTRMQTS